MPEFDAQVPFIHLEEGFPGHLVPESLRGGKGFFSIFSGATVRERRWGGENFGQVAGALSHHGYGIVILGTHADREDAKEITKLAPESIDITGKTDLKDVAQVLNCSRMFVTADSGMLHIAYGVGTPTVSLFGSGIEKKWAPPGGKHVVINARLDCSPCTRFGYTPHCEKNTACLTAIRPDHVIEEVEKLLQEFDTSG
jgi:ADP-heptose:LPS heptosyltransferase